MASEKRLSEATASLAALSREVENKGADEANRRESETSAAFMTLGVSADLGSASAKIGRAAVSVGAMLERYRSDGDKKHLNASLGLLRALNQPVKVIRDMASSPQTQFAVADIADARDAAIRAMAKLIAANELFVDTDAVDALLTSIRGINRATARLSDALDRLNLEEATTVKAAMDARSRARVTIGLARGFGDRVALITTNALRYKMLPAADVKQSVEKALKDARGMLGMLEKLGYPELRASLEKVETAFTDLTRAESAFAATRDAAQQAAAATTQQIFALSTQSRQDASEQRSQSSWLMILAIAGAALLSGLVLLVLSRLISRPIRDLTGSMSRLALGDTAVSVGSQGRRDEIGGMLAAVRVFRDNALERQKLEAARDEERSQREARQQRIEELVTRFRADTTDALGRVMSNTDALRETAEALTRSAMATAERSATAEDNARHAAHNVNAVAAAAEELNQSISEITRKIHDASQMVQNVAAGAAGANASIGSLEGAADRIGGVVSLISSIAGQTNLLALNATIEAARAGAAGRGFAVVASEVKSLASQTASATGEIGTQIAEVQAMTREAAKAMQSIAATVAEVELFITAIVAATDQQNATTAEISRNVSDASAVTSDAVDAMQRVARDAVETDDSSRRVLNASGETRDEIARLRERVEDFLAKVAAA